MRLGKIYQHVISLVISWQLMQHTCLNLLQPAFILTHLLEPGIWITCIIILRPKVWFPDNNRPSNHGVWGWGTHMPVCAYVPVCLHFQTWDRSSWNIQPLFHSIFYYSRFDGARNHNNVLLVISVLFQIFIKMLCSYA